MVTDSIFLSFVLIQRFIVVVKKRNHVFVLDFLLIPTFLTGTNYLLNISNPFTVLHSI